MDVRSNLIACDPHHNKKHDSQPRMLSRVNLTYEVYKHTSEIYHETTVQESAVGTEKSLYGGELHLENSKVAVRAMIG